MTYEVIVTSQADVDLRGIYEYIAFELLSPGNEPIWYAANMDLSNYYCSMFKTKHIAMPALY